MNNMSTNDCVRFVLASAAVVYLTALSTDAYVTRPSGLTRPISTPFVVSPFRPVVLWAAADDGESSTEEKAVEEVEDLLEEPKEEAPEEEVKEEDPEIVALKEDIAKLEGELKEKRRQASLTADQADEMSQAGYARKVAEMENMRRARSMLQSSDASAASAAILSEFVGVLEELEMLQEKYGGDEFGKQYSALPGTIRSAFSALGVTDYTVTPGEPISDTHMVVVASEYSDAQPAGTVLAPVKIGMELKGNVVRMAECIASLGVEGAEAPEEEVAQE